MRRAKTRTCAGTADKTILAPTIHIPSSHPGHQTKKHPDRNGGNISSRFFSRKTKAGNPQISRIFADGKKNVPQRTRRGTEDEDGEGEGEGNKFGGAMLTRREHAWVADKFTCSRGASMAPGRWPTNRIGTRLPCSTSRPRLERVFEHVH